MPRWYRSACWSLPSPPTPVSSYGHAGCPQEPMSAQRPGEHGAGGVLASPAALPIPSPGWPLVGFPTRSPPVPSIAHSCSPTLGGCWRGQLWRCHFLDSPNALPYGTGKPERGKVPGARRGRQGWSYRGDMAPAAREAPKFLVAGLGLGS